MIIRTVAVILPLLAVLSVFAGFGHATPPKHATVIFILSTDCPVAMAYTPRINKLVDQFSVQGIDFKALFPNELELKEKIAIYMKEREYTFRWEQDLGATKAKQLGATTVPSVIVLGPDGTKLYEGAIDDNEAGNKVKKRYLATVLSDVVAGRKASYRKTAPFGCLLMPGDEIPSIEKVNFAEHVAPIVFDHCARCHHAGEAAPFSLTTYEEAKKWSGNIAIATSKRKMPPWKAVKGFGEFHDENRLTEAQIETLQRWAQAGAPCGDAAKEPKPPAFASEWILGKPDLILTPDKAYKVSAEGTDQYRHFVLKPNLKETVYVTAMDVRPGNRKIVHHVIAFVDEKHAAERLEARAGDGQEGYDAFGTPGFIPDGALGGWAPGLRARHLPEGAGFELKPGANLVMQVHYHKNGKAEEDQTKLALYFSKKPVEHKVSIAWIANPFFHLEPGNSSQKVMIKFAIWRDLVVYGAMPHMHLLGRSMKATVEMPDGSTKPLVWVDDWDFNWQMTYAFKQPMHLPKGAKIIVEAIYDNSAKNPNNPNSPPKPVTWGEQTTDEMCLLVCAYSVDK